MKSWKICTLDKLKKGQEAVIIEINIKDWKTKRHLFEMGFVEGAKVNIKKVAPMGDPVSVEIMGYELCISKNELSKIKVQFGDESFLGFSSSVQNNQNGQKQNRPKIAHWEKTEPVLNCPLYL